VDDLGLGEELLDSTFPADVRAALRSAGNEGVLRAIGAHVCDTRGANETPLDETSEQIREAVREFADKEVAPRAESIHRGDLLIPDELLAGLAELGCFGLSIPQRYGGVMDDAEADTLSMLLATEELSAASLGAAGSLITRPEVLGRALLAGGTEEQKARWLPRLASGEQLCAVAVTEPDHGSDVASMQLRAERTETGYRLRGAKMWSTLAGRAELLMVLARTDPDPKAGHRGLSLFVIEKPPFEGHDFEVEQEGGGSLRGRAIATLGYRGMHSYELFFDGWEAPESSLVGGEAGLGRGFYMTMAGFAGGRIQTAARAVGVMQAAFAEALEYARRRRAFGSPIGTFALTRSKLARMAARLHASRRLSYAAAAAVDAGGGDMEAAMAKLFASRAAEEVTREAMQIHGGLGYAEETPVSRYFVDARVLSIFEGTEEILALKVVARSLLE
ncbi:MAG: acyl-CoA dehydrogenase family protein, partial [Thermoanaerobaculia bacterium]|nr:acyl-CoA dehydrogenase family protein [Thermoanaerobaculia bacterium]